MTHRTFLCFDYGEKRIGLAVGQAVTRTATPLTIIKVRNRTPDWEGIAAMIDQWRPDALVVGHPLNMDGTRQELTDRAERFSRALAGRYRLPVSLADERLTTIEARSRSGLREAVDAVAAQVILEAWLADSARQETIIPDRQAEMDHG